MSCTPGNAISACTQNASTGLPAGSVCQKCGQDNRFGHVCPVLDDGRRAAWALSLSDYIRQEYSHLRPVFDQQDKLDFVVCPMGIDDVPEFKKELERAGLDCQIKLTKYGHQVRPKPSQKFSWEEQQRIKAAADACGIKLSDSGGRRGKYLTSDQGFFLHVATPQVISIRHRREIERAVRMGAIVPEAVIAEYPDLQASHPLRHIAAGLLDAVRREQEAGVSVDEDGMVRVWRLAVGSLIRLKEFERYELQRQQAAAESQFVMYEWFGGYGLINTETDQITLETGTWDKEKARSMCERKRQSIAKAKTARAVDQRRAEEFRRLSDALAALVDPTNPNWESHKALADLLADPHLGPAVGRLVNLRRALDAGDASALLRQAGEADLRAQVESLLACGMNVPPEYILRFPDLIARYGI